MAGRQITRHSKIAIVGAGLSGAAVARRLCDHGFCNINVFDERPHVAGNAHTERCPETGIMLHKYGPHIFHTNDTNVWNWFNTWACLQPHIQRTKAIAGGRLYSFPINLHTLNQFWERTLGPAEARRRVSIASAQACAGIDPLNPANFEEAALSLVGRDIYRAFFHGYTVKAWGRDPRELPASILARLPMRFNYDDNVFFHKHQGIPRDGYTDAVTRMLGHRIIKLHLGRKFTPKDVSDFDHVFYTGAIDEWFHYRLGALPYRTLDFEHVIHEVDDAQGCSVINNCDLDAKWTRRTEHKHFTPWEKHDGSVVTEERSRDWVKGDIRYYPIRLANDKKALTLYQEIAVANFPDITFLGRLGTYRYLDMDQCLREAMDVADKFARNATLPIQRDLSGI